MVRWGCEACRVLIKSCSPQHPAWFLAQSRHSPKGLEASQDPDFSLRQFSVWDLEQPR